MSEALPVKGKGIVCNSDEINQHTCFLNEYTTGEHAWNIYRSALACNYSKSTASKQGKRILSTALKNERERLEKRGETMVGKIGLSREELLTELKYIITQRGDLRTKLRSMEVILRSEGLDISVDKRAVKQEFQAPILINITPPEGAVLHEKVVSVLDEGMKKNMAKNGEEPLTK